VHNVVICVKFASEFTYKNLYGVNSLLTSSSTSTQIDYCAKLNWPDDAVAKADDNFVIELLEMKKEFHERMLIWIWHMDDIRRISSNLYSYYLKHLVS